ncbi:hypothetical protein [Butyricicoccus porcorum]|uniref:Uncharacterized protein n=1 Tax=Butyricicoccus porcorum TaxID=1945634 RepID=A0A252F348_9FIRM|nr:hypothetical protein [Butyricicoccus porcorum]MCI6927333.1 hypothetical protein [Butyricicoccus porcorum]MDD6986969.1 hypothetical protein [Butyricicoccus porcorum]MDY4482362.1 hypothetical protein [Butyricicoccus porcorum]OUM20152.1 hypothetical protein CBW42_08820 [Butyricicoccus porcorum]
MADYRNLTEMLDRDRTVNEYYQALPDFIRSQLKDAEITSFDELQKYVQKIEMQERTEYPEL